MRNIKKIAFALACVIAEIFLCVFVQRTELRGGESISADPETSLKITSPDLAAKETVDKSATKSLRKEKALSVVDDTRKRTLQAALATGDASVWEPLMSQLVNPRFRPDQVVSLLETFLDSSDSLVRAVAAQLLLEMGSTKGVEALQNIIRDAANGKNGGMRAVILAAQTLHQYRYTIDQEALYRVYLKTENNDLLVIATMQHVPQVREIIEKLRAQKETPVKTEWFAAFFGMNDADSIKHYYGLLDGNMDAQLLGHWALYRATGEMNHLDFVIGKARESVGLDRAGKDDLPWTVKGSAMDYLQVTTVPESTRTLREIVNFTATKTDGNVADFDRALGALFYLHKDYEFVDQLVLNYFAGRLKGRGIDGGLLYKIAAARATPDVERAAQEFNPTAYEQTFVAMHGRPIEGWYNNQRHVPIDIGR